MGGASSLLSWLPPHLPFLRPPPHSCLSGLGPRALASLFPGSPWGHHEGLSSTAHLQSGSRPHLETQPATGSAGFENPLSSFYEGWKVLNTEMTLHKVSFPSWGPGPAPGGGPNPASLPSSPLSPLASIHTQGEKLGFARLCSRRRNRPVRAHARSSRRMTTPGVIRGAQRCRKQQVAESLHRGGPKCRENQQTGYTGNLGKAGRCRRARGIQEPSGLCGARDLGPGEMRGHTGDQARALSGGLGRSIGSQVFSIKPS